MQFYSNSQIIQLIRQRRGGLYQFLIQVPINQLRNAMQQAQRLSDLRYHASHASNIFRQNILNLTVKQILKRCKDQGIINYFQYKRQQQTSRLANHYQYGMRLVNRFPQKYYVGQSSNHYNHAKEIERLYGLRSQISSDEQQQQDNRQNENDDNDGENEQNEEKNQDDNIQKNDDEEEEEDYFIIQDDQVEFQEVDSQQQAISDLDQEEFRSGKKINRKSKLGQPRKKVKTQTKSSKQNKSNNKKAAKNSKKMNQQSSYSQFEQDVLQNYLIQTPQQKKEIQFKRNLRSNSSNNKKDAKQAQVSKCLPQTASMTKMQKMLIDSDSD